MSGRRVLLLGATGQLGSAIARAFGDWDIVAPSSGALDITSPDEVQAGVRDASPVVIINCAAFNDVDGAEDAPVRAFEVNAFAVRSLARAAEACGATLVHYSTDFVLAGDGSEPYPESTPPVPRSVYAMSKLAGEWFALEAPRAFVLRVESLFGTPPGWTGRTGTLDGIVTGLLAGREVTTFVDRIVTLSYVVDVAAATRHLVESNADAGLYHCVNSGQASWFDVAHEAARRLGVPPRCRAASVRDVTFKAPRPRYCALANHKLAAAGFPMPTWQDALGRWLAMRSDKIGVP